MNYFAPNGPRILAHRGLALDAPENTLAAFRAALGHGVTHIETDAHVTADGVAVLWHDANLRRWDGSATKIRVLSWQQLCERTVSEHSIPTLQTALTTFPTARFNIDVKTPHAINAVVRAVEAAGASERVLLTSFHERTAARLRLLAPAAAHGASRARVLRALCGMMLHTNAATATAALRVCDAVQLPWHVAGLDLVNPERIRIWHHAVREVHVWTINDAAAQRELLARGVDGIVTDRCDIGMRVLSDYLAE